MVIVEIVDEQDRSKDLFCYCGERLGLVDLPTSVYWKLNLAFNIVYIVEMLVKFYAFGFFGYWKVRHPAVARAPQTPRRSRRAPCPIRALSRSRALAPSLARPPISHTCTLSRACAHH